MNSRKEKIEKAALFDVIIREIVTEKASSNTSYGTMVFEVLRTATKDQIKAAVACIYENTVVKKVNIVNIRARAKQRGARLSKGRHKKKAYVTLAS